MVSVIHGDDRVDTASMQEFFMAGMSATIEGAVADEHFCKDFYTSAQLP